MAFYFFPEETTQNHAEMPKACAGCANECKVNTCTWWEDDPVLCPNPGSGGGCCLRYEMICDPDCEPPASPPSINGTLNCSAWGANGWCIGIEAIDLTASDPQGESLIIGGDVNGNPFACTSGHTSCSIPLPEGNGTVNYRATNALNLSGSGSKNWKLDSLSPNLSYAVDESANGLNWFNSGVIFTASASDQNPSSGLASFQYSFDNANWANYTAPINLGDGTQTLYLRTTDNAGNIESASQEIKVDSQSPVLSRNIVGTMGANGWFISSVQIEASQVDPTPASGIQYFLYSLDSGANWANYTAPIILSDGIHEVQILVRDNADNEDTLTENLKIDSTPPQIEAQVDDVPNARNWFKTELNLTATATDALSGLRDFETSLNDVTWLPYAPLTFSDGVHKIYLRATDNASNLEKIEQELKIDTQKPQISQNTSGTAGENGWYISDIQVDLSQSDPAPSSGIYLFESSLDGINWNTYTAPLHFSEGSYVLQMRVIDNADNQDLQGEALNVDTTPPTISGTLAGQLGSANFYISSVQAEMSTSDATSGIALTEYSHNGGAWQVYSVPLNFNDGFHQLQFRSSDIAGLVSYTQVFDFKIDATAPEISLPSRWYIWESGTFSIKDPTSKIAEIYYEIRDPQNRWQKITRSWSPSTHSFSHTISWNRLFANGVRAPIGNYDVRVVVKDSAGNRHEKRAQIIIPAPNATALPTFTPTPTPTNTSIPSPTATTDDTASVALATPTPFTFTPLTPTLDTEPVEVPAEENDGIFSFFSPSKDEDGNAQSPSANLLWATTAAAVTGAYLATQKKKKQKISFESEKKEAKAQTESTNISWGASASAVMGAFMEATKERRARYEARRAKWEAKKKAKRELQAIWDANGAAIYEQKKVEAKRVAAMQALNEEILSEKEDLLEEKLKRDAARRKEEQVKREKLAQQPSLADWKEADMVVASAAVGVLMEVAAQCLRVGEKVLGFGDEIGHLNCSI